MYTILTNNRETSLFTDKVRYESVTVPVEDGDPIIVVFVVFVAKNGPEAGQVQRILLNQVDAIIGGES